MTTQFINNGQWLDKPDGNGWWWHWEIHQPYIDDLDELDICIVLVEGDSIYYGGRGGVGSVSYRLGNTIKWQRVQPHSKPIP